MYYERFPEEGGGFRKLLLINGTMSTCRSIRWLAKSFADEGLDVVIYDHYGTGRSTPMKQEGRLCTMEAYVQDAVNILDELGWNEPVYVMGISFGGMVAQELALLRPERVSKLVLACTTSGGKNFPIYELLITRGIFDTTLISIRSLDTKMNDWYLYWLPFLLVWFASLVFGLRLLQWHGAIHQLQARSSHDTCDRLHHIVTPTLVCGGERDGIASVADVMEMYKGISSKNGETRIQMFNGGHLFLAQDKLAPSYISAFLKQV